MTHKELVDRAARWLINSVHCGVVAKEISAYVVSGEIPDCIGWVGSNGRSILIECKASRGDFIADFRKPSRVGGPAMGNWRFYMTPPGLLEPEKIPEDWGLYEVYNRSVRHICGVKYSNAGIPPFKNPCIKSERSILLSLLRRTNNWDRMIINTNGVEWSTQ